MLFVIFLEPSEDFYAFKCHICPVVLLDMLIMLQEMHLRFLKQYNKFKFDRKVRLAYISSFQLVSISPLPKLQKGWDIYIAR